MQRLPLVSASEVASERVLSAALDPCFQAFLLPFGAPGFVLRGIRQRILPLTAGDWHSLHVLVFA